MIEKLNRTDRSLETVHDEIRRFIDAKGQSITGDFDRERSSYIFWLQDLEQPPLLWGALLGEAIHNLRSALDHLAWQLIKRNRRPKGKPGYPILCTEPHEGFAAWARGSSSHPGMLFGAGQDAIALIEGTQPYHGGDCRLLRVLDRLWSADKHRFLIPSYVMLDPAKVLTTPLIPNAEAGPTMRITVGSGEVGERGAEIVVIELTPTGSNPQVKMEGERPLDIAFSGGQGVVESIDEISRFVRGRILGPAQNLFP